VTKTQTDIVVSRDDSVSDKITVINLKDTLTTTLGADLPQTRL
jgi:hypothetical protein